MRLAELNIDEISFQRQGSVKDAVLVGEFAGLLARLALWRERARQRAELGRLDEFARKDIGISEADVWRETRKAPWEP